MESLDDVGRWADAVVAHQRQGTRSAVVPSGHWPVSCRAIHGIRNARSRRRSRPGRNCSPRACPEWWPNGRLVADADPHRLAVATLAALQGGLLMAKATQDEASLRIPLDAAVDYLRSFLAEWREPREAPAMSSRFRRREDWRRPAPTWA